VMAVGWSPVGTKSERRAKGRPAEGVSSAVGSVDGFTLQA